MDWQIITAYLQQGFAWLEPYLELFLTAEMLQNIATHLEIWAIGALAFTILLLLLLFHLLRRKPPAPSQEPSSLAQAMQTLQDEEEEEPLTLEDEDSTDDSELIADLTIPRPNEPEPDNTHLLEVERKLKALQELHQNKLIATEVYVLKTREFIKDL